MNCNSCGSSNLIEGTIVDNDGGTASVFVPSDKSFFKKIFGIGGSKIQSYACVHCGNLQFTVDFDQKEKARYMEFEGCQPDLLKRINEDPDSQN